MNNNLNNVKYPRRMLIRSGMIFLGKALLGLMANVEIHGKESLPKKGPIILAGNHSASLEAVMMAVYNPGMVEFIGNGDIPFDPNYAFIVKAYDLIPVNRGNLDRQGLNKALSILEQDGILGIFPEGGIWDPAQMQAQIGAAWLSYRAQAPIIPIGFGGTRDGLTKALQFKRPKLVMNVGELIPPVTIADNGGLNKKTLEQSARYLLDRINTLVPEEDLRLFKRKVGERYQLKVNIYDYETDANIPLPENLPVKNGPAYARFLYKPTMLDVLVRNLHLPLCPLMDVNNRSDLAPLISAWDAILEYLKINPGYFTYRFGVDEGLCVEKALRELCTLASWVQENHYALTLTPIYRYRNAHTGAKVIERGGCFPKSLRSPLRTGLLG